MGSRTKHCGTPDAIGTALDFSFSKTTVANLSILFQLIIGINANELF